MALRSECPPGGIWFNARRNLEFILSLIAHSSLTFSPLIMHLLSADCMQEVYVRASQHSKELVADAVGLRQE